MLYIFSGNPNITMIYTNPDSPKPDLTPTSIVPDKDPSGGQYYVGESVNWKVYFKNQGEGKSCGGRVGYYLENSNNAHTNRINSDAFDDINSGATDYESDSYTFTSADLGTSKYLNIYLDYEEDVTESNETNNFLSYGPFSVVEPIKYTITLSSNPELNAVVSFNNSTWQNSGATQEFTEGESVPIYCKSEITDNQTRYIFTQWSDGNSNSSRTITVSENKTYTANYRTEYYYTSTSDYGNPQPASGWYESGTQITASVTSPDEIIEDQSQFICTGFTGSGAAPPLGSTTSTQFLLTQPSEIVWNWVKQYYLSTISDPESLPSPAGNGYYNENDEVNIIAPAVSTQYTFLKWKLDDVDAGTNNILTVLMDNYHLATAVFEEQVTGDPIYVAFNESNIATPASSEINLDILITQNVTDLHAYQILLEYDPLILELSPENISKGTFLDDETHDSYWVTPVIENGTIRIAETVLGENGVSGIGTLASLTFSVIGQGETEITTLIGQTNQTEFKNSNQISFSVESIPHCNVSIVESQNQIISLNSGWNIFSSYIIPEVRDLKTIVQPLIDNDNLVKVQNEAGNAIENISNIGWVNNIGDISPSEGYYIKVNNNQAIILDGEIVTLPYIINLSTGWNIIGFPSTTSLSSDDIMNEIIQSEKLVKVQDENGNSIEKIPNIGLINNIGDFLPGKGYYVKVTEDCDITINTTKSLGKLTSDPSTINKVNTVVYADNGFNPMNIFIKEITLDGQKFTGNIGIKILNGELEFINAYWNHTHDNVIQIIATGDDPTTENQDGFIAGRRLDFNITIPDKNIGPPNISFLNNSGGKFIGRGTMVLKIALESIPTQYALKKCYPNPFNPITNIEYSIPSRSRINIKVFDITGKQIKVLKSGIHDPGNYTITWNGTNEYEEKVASGIYFYTLQSKDFNAVEKMILLR